LLLLRPHRAPSLRTLGRPPAPHAPAHRLGWPPTLRLSSPGPRATSRTSSPGLSAGVDGPPAVGRGRPHGVPSGASGASRDASPPAIRTDLADARPAVSATPATTTWPAAPRLRRSSPSVSANHHAPLAAWLGNSPTADSAGTVALP